ncbi:MULTISPECIES: thiamine pyrophosphate-binding protein [unclassified Marinobacter]|uniref:thiamine pyrophosphate-binding protein n=1 Tax=unclassified Marinobacter TaxID=83889 RepID=UPI00200D2C49|nr:MULTISPECIES: thiamine pyrophosphate-binding protein [unclassified Marinobacter]MCL1481437.1 thiamine pyrophosphate-binding protein [Marinobacter sp.]UQG54516.1 thiamine pyrophosphate-binding protein [Marinobacter sp. M4C]UQG63321.1 thiamine pyrophosphate-binding protein [Marinobacter sp. M2C]UQG67601.1 thiamine pyrophosphate-binding protein [Marinobacter sp. M1C]
MIEKNAALTGGQVIVELLRRNGITRVFGVPGESYLPVLDALCDAADVEFVSCRHEGGATMMAEAHAKITGGPGIALVTRGPGSANAFSGLHVAYQDSTPLVVLVGQVPRDAVGREAWQEVHPQAWFGGITKWSAQVEDAKRLPELLNRAFMTAMSGRPGPVVLCLPEDLLYETLLCPPLKPALAVRPHPNIGDVERMVTLLHKSERPIIIVGGPNWTEQARRQVENFALAHAIPVAAAFRRQDRFDNAHPNYVGEAGLGMDPALAERIQNADLLIALGTRLGDIATRHYTLVEVPRPFQRLVHVHAGADEIGKVYQPDLGICSAVVPFAEALASLEQHPETSPCREDWLATAKDDYLRWTVPTRLPGKLQLGDIVTWLSETLPDDAIVTNGAGNYTLWVQRFFRYRRLHSQLAPTSGSMGYGLPAAIAAKLACPARPVICFAGDGCLLMTVQELATAIKYGVRIVVILINNASYGSIRMHQERTYDRRFGTDLHNPDFVELARSFGAEARCVNTAEDFKEFFPIALNSDKLTLIELKLDPSILKP